MRYSHCSVYIVILMSDGKFNTVASTFFVLTCSLVVLHLQRATWVTWRSTAATITNKISVHSAHCPVKSLSNNPSVILSHLSVWPGVWLTWVTWRSTAAAFIDVASGRSKPPCCGDGLSYYIHTNQNSNNLP